MRDGVKAIPFRNGSLGLLHGRGFLFLEHRNLAEVSAPASEEVPPLVRSGVSSSGPSDREAPVGVCHNVPGLLLFRNIATYAKFGEVAGGELGVP